MAVRSPPASGHGTGDKCVVQFNGLRTGGGKRDPGTVLVALVAIPAADAARHCLTQGAGNGQPFIIPAGIERETEFYLRDV